MVTSVKVDGCGVKRAPGGDIVCGTVAVATCRLDLVLDQLRLHMYKFTLCLLLDHDVDRIVCVGALCTCNLPDLR
jgi:hypothetical protein